jgi:hypothetical protein
MNAHGIAKCVWLYLERKIVWNNRVPTDSLEAPKNLGWPPDWMRRGGNAPVAAGNILDPITGQLFRRVLLAPLDSTQKGAPSFLIAPKSAGNRRVEPLKC